MTKKDIEAIRERGAMEALIGEMDSRLWDVWRLMEKVRKFDADAPACIKEARNKLNEAYELFVAQKR